MSHTNRRDFLKQSTAAGLALWVAGERGAGAPPEAAKGPNRLTVLTLEGPPLECGLKHGKALKDPIHAFLKLWKADLVRRYQMPADTFIKKFVQQTSYLAAMKKWTPELVEEIQGIARGAGTDFETMLVVQLIDEYWVHGSEVAAEHCSSLGIGRRGDQPCYVAQTMDLEGFRDGFQTVLHIKYAGSKLETLILSHVGLIGLNGMNNRSLGICCNTLSQLRHCSDGLPVACVARGALQQQSEEEALKFLHRVKHASGQNYVLGGPAGVCDRECSSGKVTPYTPKTWPDAVWHTNHPLANDDYAPDYREPPKNKKRPDNSSVRLQSLQRHLSGEVGLDRIKTTLAAKDSAEYPVCRPYSNKQDIFTFASTIMVLSDKPEFLVAPGPPDVRPYQRLTFGG
jgi:hypothetical protein